MDQPKVPNYDELPRVGDTEDRHAWDVWGRSDSLGSVNRLTPERVLAATSAIRQGKIINLDLPLNQPFPGLRPPYKYGVKISPTGRDDYLDAFWLQGSSQIDGLGHVKLRDVGYWGGREDDAVDAGEIGIDHWAEHGIVGRGVLIDVARHAAAAGLTDYDPNTRVGVDGPMMEAIAAAEGVSLDGTDFILLHTGWLSSFVGGTEDNRRAILAEFPNRGVHMAGLDGKRKTMAWLWDHNIVGALADNISLEVLPVSREDGFQHRRLIPLMGMIIGEFINIGPLAEDCANDGQYEFMVSLKALNVPGAVGSPSNGYVIK
jgi:Putative cyclase